MMTQGISIRLRLMLMTTMLLTVSCIVLTFLLNFSTEQMVDEIEMVLLEPAKSIIEKSPTKTPLKPSHPINHSMPSIIMHNAKKGFQKDSILYMLAVIIIGNVLTFYISGKALSPLKDLSRKMKHINAHNLSQKIHVPHTKDVIEDLANSFNEMTQKLHLAFAFQSQFSANAAHELRTPLTVLKTKVDVFNKKKERTIYEYEALIKVVLAHTNRMSDLVKNLLDMTNMQEVVCNETIDIYLLLEDTLHDLEDIALKNHVSLEVFGDHATVYGNYSLLHRAFYNLIENGIKYNKKNGHVSIHIQGTPHAVQVNVRDTGMGIPAHMQAQVFEPFFRVDKSRSREMGGVGIGLSMVKTIIEKHGGTITVMDNQPKGACFEVTLKSS